MQSTSLARSHIQNLKFLFPWTKHPLIVSAPMRIISGPSLAVRVSSAGGLGFIGPGAQPSDLSSALQSVKDLLSHQPNSNFTFSSYQSDLLPIGVGFQTWAGDLPIAKAILEKTKVAVVWLFAPRHDQEELDEWTKGVRTVSPRTQVWIQVASVRDAVQAVRSRERPDVLVVQGADAGGHSLKQGAGIVTLLPEVADALAMLGDNVQQIPLIAAGGIIDSRGAAATLTLGAAGVAVGTRFLASKQATISDGYQKHVLSASDGGQSTVKTQLYNHLRGTMDWPEPFDARGLANASWKEHSEGVDFETLKARHDEALKNGKGWGEQGRTATYAGTGVGLVREVKGADDIVKEIRDGIEGVMRAAQQSLEQ